MSKPQAKDGGASEVLWVQQILAGEQAAPPTRISSETRKLLLQSLVDGNKTEILSWLASRPERDAAKIGRAGIHRLRSRGVEVRTIEAQLSSPKRAHVPSSGEAAIPRSLLTAYDSLGDRLVVVAVRDETGDLLAIRTRISLHAGLQAAQVGRVSKRRYREILSELKNATRVIETEPQWGRFYVRRAAQLTLDSGRSLPGGYLRHRSLLAASSDSERHPALGLNSSPPTSLDSAKQLLTRPELATWVPDRLALSSMAREVQKIVTSEVILDEAQRERMLQEALHDWATAYFDRNRCQAAERLLMDTAHLLMLQGEASLAEQARGAAACFAEDPAQGQRQLLIEAFVNRLVPADLLQRTRPARNEDQQPGSLIVSPGSGSA